MLSLLSCSAFIQWDQNRGSDFNLFCGRCGAGLVLVRSRMLLDMMSPSQIVAGLSGRNEQAHSVVGSETKRSWHGSYDAESAVTWLLTARCSARCSHEITRARPSVAGSPSPTREKQLSTAAL